jgi:predicted flap endonuclease-1-like 5' DNA nuclease
VYYKITEIEGIGPEFVLKLQNAGITTTEHLLYKARDTKSRSGLAGTTAISEPLLTKWVATADLMRVKGISKRYSDLLLASGVDSTDKLLMFEPKDLVRKMEEQNKLEKLVVDVPQHTEVEQWLKELRSSEFTHVK